MQEIRRLEAVAATRLRESELAALLDGLATAAASAVAAPMGVVDLVERDAVRAVGVFGAERRLYRREHAFCAITIRGVQPLVVPDALHDPRFATNPFVYGEPGIRAYLGAPILDRAGCALGAVCAVDLRPRAFTETAVAAVAALARVAGAIADLSADAATLHHLAQRLGVPARQLDAAVGPPDAARALGAALVAGSA